MPRIHNGYSEIVTYRTMCGEKKSHDFFKAVVEVFSVAVSVSSEQHNEHQKIHIHIKKHTTDAGSTA